MIDRVAVLIVAAGRGMRAGGGLPKQYRPLGAVPMLARTIDALAAGAPGAPVTVVIGPADAELYARALASVADAARANLRPAVVGGDTRQASVRAGLAALSDCDIVLIHDGARPFPSPALIARAITAAAANGAAVPGVPLADTIKQIDAAGIVTGTVARQPLRAAQTPQAFRYALIRDAHERARAAGGDFTDDAAIAEWAGAAVHVIEGEASNMKVTTPADFAAAEAQLLANLPDIRVGQGFDVHACAEGDHVWLGGIRVAHHASLAGHSDADVVLHALTDALLGAIADGDIGTHFPPSDPRWRGMESKVFLLDAAERVRKRGGWIAHVDATVVCELPKIGPHREAMRSSIAAILGIDIGRVAVKATTSERLGFTGRGEGIAALASATVRLPL